MNLSSCLSERKEAKGLIISVPEPQSAEELDKFAPIIESSKKYGPSFAGPISPQESVEKVLKVVKSATVEKDGGAC
jgi:hypothetical protein